MQKVVPLLVLLCGLHFANAGVTVEQMQKAGELVRSICQPKFKIDDDVANGLGKGVFPEDKNTKCYVNCIFENMQSMKRGKFQYENSKKQAEILLPDEIKEPTIRAMTACKSSTDGIKDPCEAAFSLLNCFKQNNDAFFFP
ncbi:General odorant-binding protein 72 [Sergentomyia squamirostris]